LTDTYETHLIVTKYANAIDAAKQVLVEQMAGILGDRGLTVESNFNKVVIPHQGPRPHWVPRAGISERGGHRCVARTRTDSGEARPAARAGRLAERGSPLPLHLREVCLVRGMQEPVCPARPRSPLLASAT
jgi:hypothetical protein